MNYEIAEKQNMKYFSDLKLLEMKTHILLKDLHVYSLSRRLSSMAWDIYCLMSVEDKKIMGDQFIRATDSIGANIAEGYARFHNLDRVRFYYNSRASLSEASDHWLELLFERHKISDLFLEGFKSVATELQIKLNNFIRHTKNESQ